MTHVLHRGTGPPVNNTTMSAKMALPTSQHINYPLGIDPRKTKQAKHQRPKPRGEVTMKEQMINGLTTLLAHMTPLYNINILPTKIVHGKDLQRLSMVRILPLAVVHVKNSTLGGTFTLQIKEPCNHLKNITLSRMPPNLIFRHTSNVDRV
jgi:hypothetical protein